MFFMMIVLMVMMVAVMVMMMMVMIMIDYFLYDEWSWMVLFMPYHDRYENIR